MAQPIALETATRDVREELRKRLEKAPVEHAAALLDSYELLQQLHDHGVMELLRGMLGASDRLVETAVEGAKSETSVNALRNAVILGKMLGSINPDILKCVALAAGETLGTMKRPVIEPPGLFALLSQFRHKKLRQSIALINRFLESLGNQLTLLGSSKGKH